MKDPVRDESWREDALCQQVGPFLFFPPKGGDNGLQAKKVCALCHVREQCLEFAVTSFQPAGIWGGKGVRDLERIRSERGLVEPVEEAA